MEKIDLNVDVRHVTRVEGHGNIVLDVRAGEIRELRLEIVESPRFFESMLKGRRAEEAPLITARICGICAVGHTLASLRAIESALGIAPSEQTVLLRRLILNGELLQSHILHIYFLVVPDLLGAGSVVPLARSHAAVVKRALRLKQIANDVCAIVGGRHIHPVSLAVNGMKKLPTRHELEVMEGWFREAQRELDETLELFLTLKLPDFCRPCTYVSLVREGEYAFYDGEIRASDGTRAQALDYRQVIRESVVRYSTAKHVAVNEQSIMVGALARFNHNHAFLLPRAKIAAERLGLHAPDSNPFHITLAQLVESFQVVEHSLVLLEELKRRGLRREPVPAERRAGRGVGAVEVPRGTLYHEYELDGAGRILRANCIIPTGQNLANIENDLRAFVPGVLEKSKEEITLGLEMLVRAYDPCISCSTHFLDVEFV